MDKFNQIKALIASLEADADKFYNKANGAAGTRLRKAMQELKAMTTEVRKEVLEARGSKY